MTSRLYQTQQLRAAQQQRGSCTDTLQNGAMNLRMQKPLESSGRQLQVHISSCNASDEDAEVLLTSTAVPSSLRLHHSRPPPPPPIYQQHLQSASVTSSYQRGIGGSGDLLAEPKSDSFTSLSSARGLKAAVPLPPLDTQHRIHSVASICGVHTRGCQNLKRRDALRRAPRAPQLHMERLVSPLCAAPLHTAPVSLVIHSNNMTRIGGVAILPRDFSSSVPG